MEKPRPVKKHSYTCIATATQAAAVGVVGALTLSTLQGSMNWPTFRDALMSTTRLYCRIPLILSGAAFLTLVMGYVGLPRHRHLATASDP